MVLWCDIRDFHTLAVINHRCDREVKKYVVELKSGIEFDVRTEILGHHTVLLFGHHILFEND